MQCRAAIGGCLEGEIRICSQKLLAMFVPIQVAAREDVDLGSRSEESFHCFIISIPGRCVERRQSVFVLLVNGIRLLIDRPPECRLIVRRNASKMVDAVMAYEKMEVIGLPSASR